MIALGLAMGLGLLSGCDGDDVTMAGAVTGKVTLDDQPVDSGVVTLLSTDGYAQTATIESGGTFTISEGLPVGEYKVTVSPPEMTEAGDPNQAMPEYKVPQGYYQETSSDIKVTLTEDPNAVTIELKSSGPSGGGGGGANRAP